MIPISVEKANQILYYLKTKDGIDRFYLNDFNNIKTMTTSDNQEPELINESVYHDKCFYLENVSDVIFKFPNVDLRPFDKLEIAILSKDLLVLDDISLYFSEFANANIPLESAQLNKDETIINSNLYLLAFDLKDKDGAKYYLPNVTSVKLMFKEELSEVKVVNIMVKADEYDLPLDKLQPALDDANDYILKRIPDDSIPKELEKEVPKKAASMLWLIARQGKGESNVGSEVGKFTQKNFHDKLKLEVDEAIAEYIGETPSDDGRRPINQKLVGWI